MNTNSTHTQTSESPPYRRWFWYLAIASTLALASPYFASKDSRYQCPDIRFYPDGNFKTEPMTQNIWIDAHLYAEHETRAMWLVFGFIIVGVEAVGYGIYRLPSPWRPHG